MKKAVLCLLLSILLLPMYGTAETSESTGFDLKTLAEDTVFLVNLNDPTHAILGLERNADVKRYPASTTKIMTCILALEKSEFDEPVKISKRACNLTERNSKMGLIPGETFPMIDLIYGLMLPSGNDAAIAIAEHIGGSVDGFVKLMNEKAKELGMTGTHYMNPHGLHHSEHYTTARDLALLTAYAFENDTFREIVATAEYRAISVEGRELILRNANRLLRDVTANTYQPYSCLYEYAIGVKTGDTHLAGKCLVAAAQKGDTVYLLVLLHGKNAPDSAKGREKDSYAAQRFYDAIKLFDYAFENDTVTLNADDLLRRCLPETYAVSPDPERTFATEILYRIQWNEADTLTLPRWQAELFARDPFPEEYVTYSIDTYSAPVGTVAGCAAVTFNGEDVFRGELIADEYTYPPTPEPTEEPILIISEETASPDPSTQAAAPSPSPEWMPIATEPPKEAGFWFFRLFRCSPHD
ncbi:MAG: D-alanyl-D-alanine carboxypeptidase [Clostridia bacterium]|nr:D-alanyl-D-alanine carboxypeptidase [Clostridia bacterium]